MLSALILITCSTVGFDCTTTVVADNIPFHTCPIAAQSEAAKYIHDHPKRKVVRMICADPRRIQFYLHRNEA
ncbi:hypothetical protein [Manganibacter manganicus]|uniref:Uncharacterized protein n=1 Tax=Manganibacter manganicus TaxID=1873176 RepID=A0A1V8RNZ0_9HYPH|nr:hypothetical protein [Pseudaminobacter manganicus]OQM74921.1 hypothetical protein BFN67_04720 [Pseudaminobacter manganicus]